MTQYTNTAVQERRDDPEEAQRFFDGMKERYAMYDSKGITYIEQIDEMLSAGSTIEQVKELLLSDECKKICNVDNAYVVAAHMLAIAEKEELIGEPTFWYHMTSVDEIEQLSKLVHFYLRRIECGWPMEEWEEMSYLLTDYDISAICLAELICKTKYKRPRYLSKNIATLMQNMGKKVDAAKLLALTEKYLTA